VGASRLLGGTGENEMTGRRIEATTLAIVVLAAAALYAARLSHVPSFLSNDETAFGLQAHAIATTAHDENGRLLPVYFQMMENVWFHPALVYWMAPVLAVVRPTPWAVRLPTVIIAMINLVLVFALGRRLGLSRAAAIGASVLLSLTPAHLLHGRLACDYLLPVPCVLAWLIMLIDAQKSGASWRFFAAGCILGVGLYTYIASLVTMPVCLFLSYVAMYSSGIRRLRPYVMITTGFAVLLVPAVTYLLAVPQLYAGFSARYGGANVDVLHDPRAMFELDIMAKRWAVYRSFFEWRFLFEKAETHVMSSTYTSGIFLKVMKVLIPIGAYHILRNRLTTFTGLLLAAFFSAPLAASLIPEKYAIDRALTLLPMGVLIGAFGIDWLLVRRAWVATWAGRALCAGLCVWMVVQFNEFYREYQFNYPIRASPWFDGNHPGAFDAIVQRYGSDDRTFIYLSNGLPRIREQWKLYLLGHRRRDLLSRTVVFTPQDLHFEVVRAGSLLLTGADDPVERAFQKMPEVRAVTQIMEPDGTPSFTIFERTEHSVLYAFDGTYSAEVNLACAPGRASDRCLTLATTAACPSMETLTVANNLVLDSCGYLQPVLLTDRGFFQGSSTTLGIRVEGQFATNGRFMLSGTHMAGMTRYQLDFSVTKSK